MIAEELQAKDDTSSKRFGGGQKQVLNSSMYNSMGVWCGGGAI